MTPTSVAGLLMRLSERDLSILESLWSFRLLSTAQIRRLHFHTGHATVAAASSATMRVLSRLEAQHLVARLHRRIGGVRAGSSGIVWQLGAAGERLLRAMRSETRRRRYIEPTMTFMAHTLAVAELAVRLQELENSGAIELVAVETEPSCWRSFVGPHGAIEWLKPDLFAVTASGDFEDHRFFEADLGTEHPPVVVRKAKVFQRYAATGAHQARHGLFPAVVWVVPGPGRQAALQAALAADKAIQPGLFRVVTTEELTELITQGHAAPATSGQESTNT